MALVLSIVNEGTWNIILFLLLERRIATKSSSLKHTFLRALKPRHELIFECGFVSLKHTNVSVQRAKIEPLIICDSLP